MAESLAPGLRRGDGSRQKQKFPWPALMQRGLHHLKLPPEQFWRATLREICPAHLHATPLPRAQLVQLMKRFPDR
jgi:uncharacterized phage protein (TIGR02216 family)